MKIKRCFYALGMCIMGCISACNGQPGAGSKNKLYEFRSMAVEYEIRSEGNGTRSGGSKSLWIDDYGNKQSEIRKETTSITMLGNTTTENKEEQTIILGNLVYTINLKDKTGTKQDIEVLRKMGEAFAGHLNSTGSSVREFTKDFVEKNGGRWLPSETFLGKKCDVIEMMGVKQWIYKGVPLRIESNMMGMKISETATSISEEVSVPAIRFTVPQGIAITDAGTLLDNMGDDMENADMPMEKIDMDYSAFEKAARKVNISGYTLLNCTNDEGSYMAMFIKQTRRLLVFMAILHRCFQPCHQVQREQK
ncbi:MAG: hypothetical protein HC905_04355 [Bacteroidales bacterium]|nr:hypothetical protein [Bacteroidales bacterium]